MDFQLVSNYVPTGDQPKAIDKLVQGIQAGDREQTLLGVTGSGSASFSLIMQLNILFPIMIIINPKRILRKQIPILKKILPLTMR